MCVLFQSKGQELIGNPCQGTGVKTGKVTVTSTAKASHLRSPQVMATLLSLTMLPQLAGPLAKPSVACKLPEVETQPPKSSSFFFFFFFHIFKYKIMSVIALVESGIKMTKGLF